MTRRTVVYIIGQADGVTVKIGEGAWPDRLNQLNVEARRQGADKWTPLAVMDGHRAQEQEIHTYFRSANIAARGGEVFTAPRDSHLYEYIVWLRDQWFVSVDDALPEKAQGFEHWRPTTERRKRVVGDFLSFSPWDHLGHREVMGDDFYTDGKIVRLAREAMGGIDLDPASHVLANSMHCIPKIYTLSDNGLLQDWGGRIWLNPPFRAWSEFVKKFQAEAAAGRIEQACVYLASRTSNNAYFRPMLESAKALCVTTGRIANWGPRAASPDSGHQILYYGSRIEEFIESFSEIGVSWRLERK